MAKYDIDQIKELLEEIKKFNAGAVDSYLNEYIDDLCSEWVTKNSIEETDYVIEEENIEDIVPNPVGTPIEDSAIEEFIKMKMLEWDVTRKKIRWYQFWKRISFTPTTKFLTNSLDELIAYVDDYVDTEGADKKATVLEAIGVIYDYVVAETLPVFMKPFSSSIKKYVINDIMSAMIDWVVDKYRNGDWRKPSAVSLSNKWKLKIQSMNS